MFRILKNRSDHLFQIVASIASLYQLAVEKLDVFLEDKKIGVEDKEIRKTSFKIFEEILMVKLSSIANIKNGE